MKRARLRSPDVSASAVALGRLPGLVRQLHSESNPTQAAPDDTGFALPRRNGQLYSSGVADLHLQARSERVTTCCVSRDAQGVRARNPRTEWTGNSPPPMPVLLRLPSSLRAAQCAALAAHVGTADTPSRCTWTYDGSAAATVCGRGSRRHGPFLHPVTDAGLWSLVPPARSRPPQPSTPRQRWDRGSHRSSRRRGGRQRPPACTCGSSIRPSGRGARGAAGDNSSAHT